MCSTNLITIDCRKRSWPSPPLGIQDKRTENCGSMVSHWHPSFSTWRETEHLPPSFAPFSPCFPNKLKVKKPNMTKDILVGPSDWSLAGHLMPHQGERGPSRVPTRAVQNMEPLNYVGAQQWSGRMKPCWCWQRKHHSNRSWRNPGQHPFPGILVCLPSKLSLTSHTCLDSVSRACPGSRRDHLVTKEQGTRSYVPWSGHLTVSRQGEQGRPGDVWITEHSYCPALNLAETKPETSLCSR